MFLSFLQDGGDYFDSSDLETVDEADGSHLGDSSDDDFQSSDYGMILRLVERDLMPDAKESAAKLLPDLITTALEVHLKIIHNISASYLFSYDQQRNLSAS